MAWNKEVTCSTGEVVGSYNEYLQTKHWADLSDRIKELADGKCSKCGTNPRYKELLNAHHLTYFNIGNENDEDLICVCMACHMTLHGVKKCRNGKPLKNKTVMEGKRRLLKMKRESDKIIEIFKTSDNPQDVLKLEYPKTFVRAIMRSSLFKDYNNQWKPKKRKIDYSTTRNGKRV